MTMLTSEFENKKDMICGSCPYNQIATIKGIRFVVCDNRDSDHYGHYLTIAHVMCILGTKAIKDA